MLQHYTRDDSTQHGNQILVTLPNNSGGLSKNHTNTQTDLHLTPSSTRDDEHKANHREQTRFFLSSQLLY